MNTAKPRGYFSFRSPYSWLAFHDLSRRRPEVAQQIEWRPFWEPDASFAAALDVAGAEFPYTPMHRAKHLYILRDVRRLARQRNLQVSWPADHETWWEPSHLFWFLADEAGRGLDYLDAIYTARWIDGQDICLPEVVAQAARRGGIDCDDPRAVMADPEIRAKALAALHDVYHDDVFGVPLFVIRREKYWGLDRLRDFLVHLDTGAPPTSLDDHLDEREPEAVQHPYDHVGHAGGCG